MSKGKNFNSAEKYFKEKEVKYQKKLSQYESVILQMKKELSSLIDEQKRLQYENDKQHEWIERLLSYTELSMDDIKVVCKQDKERGKAMVDFMGLTGLISKYY